MGRERVRPHSHQRKCHSGYSSDFREGQVGIVETQLARCPKPRGREGTRILFLFWGFIWLKGTARVTCLPTYDYNSSTKNYKNETFPKY